MIDFKIVLQSVGIVLGGFIVLALYSMLMVYCFRNYEIIGYIVCLSPLFISLTGIVYNYLKIEKG